MNAKKIKENVKKAWNWIWNSDSVWSWLVALIVIFIVVKLIFFPVLSLIMGTSLPLAGVESSSMDHQIVKDQGSSLNLCGNSYSKENKQYINFNEYWEICGGWYEGREITKETFSKFSLKNGFRKGDIIIVWGRFTPKLGDIIIFQPNIDSRAPRPIIHRIVGISEEGIIQTKGDHNKDQLTTSNNGYKTDETNIKESQIIGKAIIKIPYLGWVKIWFTELINAFKR
jgi:signal peptidase I